MDNFLCVEITLKHILRCKDNKNLEYASKIMEFSMIYIKKCSIMTTPLFSFFIYWKYYQAKSEAIASVKGHVK